jgi:predicted nucleic acid-binding protein
MIYVLDACAMIALLRKENGWEVVRSIVEDTNNICQAHALNLYEVFYDFARAADENVAEEAISDLFKVGIIERNDMDGAFWRQAGRLKAVHRVSVCDCCAIVLNQRIGGTLVTSDHHELDALAAVGVCPITFFR